MSHEEIKGRKSLTDIFDNFEMLLGMCLLFKKDSVNYVNSGFVTAALSKQTGEESNIYILAIQTQTQWITFRLSRACTRK